MAKADVMKAAAGMLFQRFTGYADACRKLSLGDPAKATPHIIYYLNKIKASAELQAHLMKDLAEEAADAVATADTTADETTLSTPYTAMLPPAKPPNTAGQPSGGYMDCGGSFEAYQVHPSFASFISHH